MRQLPIFVAFLFLFADSSGASQEETQHARGTYLVIGIVACGNYHSSRNADATAKAEMHLASGSFAHPCRYPPHPQQGIGEWTDDEIKGAITQGVSRDGRKLVRIMSFDYYRNISDEDLDALIVYLRSLPAQPPD